MIPPQGGSPPGGTAIPPQGGLPTSSTYVLNQTVVNEGCNYGTVSTNETHVAVEQVVQIAEARHYETVTQLAEAANHEHLRQMANLSREAETAFQRQAAEAVAYAENLERNHAVQRASAEAAYYARVSQLETALELQENGNVQVLAQEERERKELVARAWRAEPESSRSSPGSANFNDAQSQEGSMRSQPGLLASLAANALPFARSFAHKPGPTSSQETWDAHTAGKGGSQSSTSYAYPTDLFDASQNVAIPPQGGLFDGSPLVAALPPQGGVPGVVTRGQTQRRTLTVTAQTQNDDG